MLLRRAVARWVVLLALVVVTGGGCASNQRPLQLVGGGGPEYPAEARASGVEGYVTIRYDVTVDGRVSNARVVASQPAGVFDAAALASVSSWRFNAPRENGRPVPALNRESTVTFRLGDPDEYNRD